MEKSYLEKLKRDYEEIKKKYSLPDYKALNEEFDIEKLQDKETDMLLREVRRALTEKITSYLKFVEMFIAPGETPMFFLVLMKGLSISEKKILEELYTELGKMEIKALALDNLSDDKKEADFIKHVYAKWPNIKEKFAIIFSELEKSFEKTTLKKEKGYLG